MQDFELVLGRIHPCAQEATVVEGLLIRDGKVVAIGSRSELEQLAGGLTRIGFVRDFEDRTILPGFIDCHLHVFWLGSLLLRQADLVDSSDMEEVLRRLRSHADQTSCPWILGRGWDQDKLSEKREPTRAELDRCFPDKPVLITRVCGHCAIANSAAIDHLSADDRDAGDPETGRYTETAIAAFHRVIPELTRDEQEEAVRRAEAVALRNGITTVGTLLDTSDQMGAYFRLHRRRELRFRVVGMPPWKSVDALHANGVGTGFGDDQLRFGGAKLFADGSFGARTALLSSPYSDHPDTSNLGIRIYEPADLVRRVTEADRKGFQIVIHAIGDQAVREAVEAIETALDGQPNCLRHRIEHVSLAQADLRKRMAEAGILAVVQPQFVTSDTWTGERLGPERAIDAYPFRTLRDNGVRLGLSSDCPVEKLDPFALLAAAVWRHPWSPGGGLTLDEALSDYTQGSAYALGIENSVGSLQAGKWADYVVVSRSPWGLSESEFRELTVEETFVAGISQERQTL